jgi:hypothetical protein
VEECNQGDRMSLRKKITQNVDQPLFVKIYHTTYTVDTSGPKIRATCLHM